MACSGVSRLFKPPLIQLALSVLHINDQIAGHGVKSMERVRLAICMLFTDTAEPETAHAAAWVSARLKAGGLTPRGPEIGHVSPCPDMLGFLLARYCCVVKGCNGL